MVVGGTRWATACEIAITTIEGHDAVDRPLCTACSPANMCAWFCILVLSGLYFGTAFPFYWAKVNPLLPLTALFFFLLTVGCLFAACYTDPGIIPRREVILALGLQGRLKDQLGYDVLGEPMTPSLGSSDPSNMTVPSELRGSGYRWCSTCHIVRPPRASHCPECDNCVLRFDHHCPFVNNCVGQRNYLFFMGFTTSVCCLAVLVIPFLLWYLVVGLHKDESEDSRTSIGEVDRSSLVTGVLITLAVAGGLSALLVIGLWAYHVFLICTGLTTKEHWRGTSEVKARLPGMGEELTIFGRRGPRLFDPRSLVEVEHDASEIGRRRWQLKEPSNAVPGV